MSKAPPSLKEYIELSNEAYTLHTLLSKNGGLITATDPFPEFFAGMRVVDHSDPVDLAKGFAAVALQDWDGNIIIVNEGTLMANNFFMGETIAADIQVGQDKTGEGLRAATTFADRVEAKAQALRHTTDPVQIYVTGHSLGGIDAQKEAERLQELGILAGGATFGATGLPQQDTPTDAGINAKFINYVDRGDMVGNYARDTTTQTPNPFGPAAYHFGKVVEVGPVSHAAYLQKAQNYFLASEITNYLTKGMNFGVADQLEAMALYNDAHALEYHLMSVYGEDLGYSENEVEFTPPEQTLPGMSLEWSTQEFASFFGNTAVSNMQNAKAVGNTVVTPYFTGSANLTTNEVTITQTGDITTSQGVAASGGVTTFSIDPLSEEVDSANYTSADGSTYAATYNAAGDLLTLTGNSSNGTSYQTAYTYNPDSSIDMLTTVYTGPNLTGDIQFTETNHISASGEITVDLSGSSNYVTLNEAKITLEAGASASITGTGNILKFLDASESSIALDPGTFVHTSEYDNSANISATLMDQGITLGTLTFNTSDDTDSFTFLDGMVLELPGISGDMEVTGPTIIAALGGQQLPTGESPLQILSGYLSDLGYTDDLIEANFNYLFPFGLPDYSGVSTLNVVGNTAVTQEYLDGFESIAGNGTLIAAEGGEYDLSGAPIAPGSNINLTAVGWDGTVLVGDDRGGEVLTASLLGDDTLQAGNGSSVTLAAGLGMDTLLGGAGGGTGVNFFYAPYGIADGSQFIGNADNDWLEVGGAGQQATVYDLTGVLLDGMDTLVADNVKIDNTQFTALTAIEGWGGDDVIINTADGGTYDLNGVYSGIYAMTALSNEGTTLRGNNVGSGVLTASAFGNDTLVAGNGDFDQLIAGGGVDSLIGGTGDEDQFAATNGLRAGSYLESNNSSSIIETNGDISGVTLAGTFGSLTITGGDSITLTASQMASVGSNIFATDGDVLYAASGGTFVHSNDESDSYGSLDMIALSNSGTTLSEDYATDAELVASASGNDTLTLTNSTGSFLDASDTGGAITISSVYGSNNVIDASGSTGTVSIDTDLDSSDTIYAGDGTETIHVGGGSTLYAGAGTETIYLDGSLNAFYAGTGTETIYVAGNGNTVSGLLASDTLIYSGAGDVFDISDADGIAATIGGSFSTVDMGKNVTATVSGTHDTVVMGLRSTATVSGSSNTLSFSGNSATISGSSNTILASGNNTFTVTGSNNTLTDYNGADTFIVGGTSTTGVTINGKAYDTYEFVSNFGQDTVNNATGGSSPLGQIIFGTGISAQNLWFAQSGNNLLIERMGTTQRVTVTDWFSNNGAKVQNIVLNDGYELTAGDVAALVSAMATYASANPAFDPTAVSSVPSDTTLQAAVTTAWNTSVSPNVDITQTAAVIQQELDHIQSLADMGELGAITLTDSGTPTIAVTAAQLVSDADALAAIVSAYDLSVDGVTVANVAAAAAATNVAAVNVTDTAANVAASLDDLQTLAVAGTLGTVTLTDTTLLTVTETQFTNDADALALLATGTLLEVTDVAAADAATVAANTDVVLIAVSDTAANVTANIAALETLAAAGELESVAFTDTGTPALSFSAADAAADIDALVSFTGAFTLDVTDTAANVAANLDALGELAAFEELTSITLTDSGTPTLAITADQAASDAAALGLITGSYGVAVSDTGANVAADLDALQALADAGVLSSVTLTDSTTPTLSVTNSQLTDDADALAAIAGSYNLAVSGVSAADAAAVAAITHVVSVTIEDTAAHVTANLDDLETLADGGMLTLIALTDTSAPTLSLTAAQLAGDTDALDVIFGLYSLAVSGVLAANAASVASVANVTTIAISDTAANVTTNLTTLQALAAAGMLASIALTDAGTPVLSLSQAQLGLDADALAAITTTYTVSVTAVTAGNAANAAAQTGVTSVAVSDTAANVAANLDALETLATGGKLSSITLINTDTPTLTITASQLSSDADALGLIAGSYHLAVTAVSAASATTVAANSHVTSITLSDTAANVVANLDALEGVIGLLTSFALTNSGTPTVSITGTQFVNDIAVVNKITSAYNLAVSNALAAGASALNGNTHVTSASFSDTAANVSANFAALQSLVTSSKLASGGVTLTDGGTPALSITDAQFTSSTGTTVLADIPGGAYTLALSAVSYANASTRIALTRVVSVAIADTASVLGTNLNSIQTLAAAMSSKLVGISVTNNTTAVALTYTQWTNDGTAIGLFTGTYHFSVTAVTAAGAATVASNTHATSISVSDTSAHVATSIDSLQTVAAAGQLTAIAVTDGTNTITITAAQAAGDYAALAKLTGTYKVGVTDTAANISASIDALQTLYLLETTKLTITASDSGTNHVGISVAQAISDAGAIGRLAAGTVLTVTDTAANVSANFQTLVSLGTKLGTIMLTDGGTPVLALTDALYSPNSATLAKISGAYNLALSGVSYANYSARNGVSNVVSISIGDTAANLSTNLNAIQSLAVAGSSKLTGISVTNSATPVTFTYTQLSSDSTALGLFTGTYSFNVTAVSIANATTVLGVSHVAAVNISDTAANVQSNINALQTLAAASQLTGIVLTSGTTMTLSAATAANDAAALQKITSAYTLTVSDTAANIAASLDGLQTLETAIGATKFSSVTITDVATNKVGITAAQATADQVVINKFSGTGNVIATDSAANVVSNLAGLQAVNAKISSIVLSDGGTPNLAITGAQYTADITAINKIASAYTMTVSAVTGANAATVGGNSHVTAFTVSDTAANLGTNMDSLQAQSGKTTSITVSNNTVAVPITYTQFTSTDTTAVGLFTGTYSFTVSAVSVANAATIAAQSHVAWVSVSDTAANVSAGLDGLQALGGDLLTLSLTDGATNNVSINSSQAVNDAGAIGKSTGTFHITVTDSSANILTNIATLNSLGTKLTTIVLTDGGTPNFNLTGTQYSNDITTLNKITSAYTMTVSSVTAQNAGTVGANTHVTSYAVVDSAALVGNTTYLAAMQSHLSNLASITLTDSGTPTLAITGAQLNGDAGAIAKIVSTYNERVAATANSNETLAGTGTVNTISFASETQGVNADLSAGTATTVHTGTTFTTTLSSFANIIGSTHVDTLTAGAGGSVLTGQGGADTFVLNASGIDVARDIYADLNGSTVQNFSALDGIDITNLTFSGSTLGFSEDASNTFGTLTVTGGGHSAAIKLLGQYTVSDFQKVSDGGTGTLVALASTTHLTDILAAAQS